MRRALVEAGVLDEMFLAGVTHDAAVIPVEVVQVGVISMSFFCSVRRTARVITPRRALTQTERNRVLPKSPDLIMCASTPAHLQSTFTRLAKIQSKTDMRTVSEQDQIIHYLTLRGLGSHPSYKCVFFFQLMM